MRFCKDLWPSAPLCLLLGSLAPDGLTQAYRLYNPLIVRGALDRSNVTLRTLQRRADFGPQVDDALQSCFGESRRTHAGLLFCGRSFDLNTVADAMRVIGYSVGVYSP